MHNLVNSVEVSDQLISKIEGNTIKSYSEEYNMGYSFVITDSATEVLRKNLVGIEGFVTYEDVAIVSFDEIAQYGVNSRREIYEYCKNENLNVLSPMVLLSMLDGHFDRLFGSFITAKIYVAMDPFKTSNGRHILLEASFEKIDVVDSSISAMDLKNSLWLFSSRRKYSAS